MEYHRYCTVGSFFKNPINPVWVLASDTHLTGTKLSSIIVTFRPVLHQLPMLIKWSSKTELTSKTYNEIKHGNTSLQHSVLCLNKHVIHSQPYIQATCIMLVRRIFNVKMYGLFRYKNFKRDAQIFVDETNIRLDGRRHRFIREPRNQ